MSIPPLQKGTNIPAHTNFENVDAFNGFLSPTLCILNR